jgi:hypothetical protein
MIFFLENDFFFKIYNKNYQNYKMDFFKKKIVVGLCIPQMGMEP